MLKNPFLRKLNNELVCTFYTSAIEHLVKA